MKIARPSMAAAAAGLLVTGGMVALPQSAQALPPECTGTFDYVAEAPQGCIVPGVAERNRMQTLLIEAHGGGGGSGTQGRKRPGGNGAQVLMQSVLPSGDQLDTYAARGGLRSDTTDDGAGAGGGGSSAVLHNGTVLAEAGGGGGGSNGFADGGNAGITTDGAGQDGAGLCSGLGGNTDLAGTGGAGGPRDATFCDAASTSPNYPVNGGAGSSGLGGNGGDGGNEYGVSGSVTGSGGYGFGRGGDGGLMSSFLAAGAGGGGGYGGGGGGAAIDVDADSDDASVSGGSGGSWVNLETVPLMYVITMAFNGGSGGNDGGNGKVMYTPGPSAVTQAKTPDTTSTTATTHSLIDPNSDQDGISRAYILYSTDPTLKSGVQKVDSDPVSLPAGKGDRALTTTLTGLTPGTRYCYQVWGERLVSKPSRTPRVMDGYPVAMGAIECFTTAVEPTPTPTPTPDDKKNQKPMGKNKLPKSVKKSGTTMLAPAGAKTNAGQRLRTRVRCVPLNSATAGETRYCSVSRKANGKVTLTTFGRSVRVIVVQTAAPTSEYKRYSKRTVYTVRA